MTADVAVSVWVLAGVVALSDAGRRLLLRACGDCSSAAYAVELVSTFQLCCCTHELKLLSEVGGVEPRLALTLTYLASVVHGFTFRGAIGNPTGTLEHVYRERLTRTCALKRIACQFAAAVAARAAMQMVWGVGLSMLHVRHKDLGYQCTSPIRASVLSATAVEMMCACTVQSVVTHTRSMEEKYRVHAVAAVITTVVYAGGRLTGAVFNPAVAFSIQFYCGEHSFLQYCVVYWMGPVLGMMLSVLLSDQLLPLLTTKPQPLIGSREDDKKRKKL